jgi:hypothetical protein
MYIYDNILNISVLIFAQKILHLLIPNASIAIKTVFLVMEKIQTIALNVGIKKKKFFLKVPA